MAILQDADEDSWGARPDDALYLHGLRVRRAYAGQGIGRAILRWAEEQVTACGRRYQEKARYLEKGAIPASGMGLNGPSLLPIS
jgi:GNAT superfamily N-acetyltransferase